MSGTTLRLIIAAVLCFHGIGHVMGIIPALGIIKTDASSPDWLKGWSSHSWLLTNLLGEGVSRILSVILFLAALVGTLAAVLALLGWGVPHDSWRTLAIVSAIISFVTIVLYWNALIFFFPHKVGSLGVDIAILVCLLGANWPTESAIGW
jgi:hypothetical protein